MKIPILRVPFDEDDISFIKEGIENVLRSGQLTMNGRVAEFERLFARFCGTRYAVATNSGTSSIEMALRAIGVEGSSVIVPSNTYMATPIAVVKAGAKVVFAECQKENFQIDPDDIERKITPRVKAVIVVHIGGIISPHFDRIKRICEEKGVLLIEDAAHAHGAVFKNKMAGSLALAGSFSFYPTKVFTTAEGGMLTTDSEEIYQKAIVLREHGKADHNRNIHVEFGDNWRFSEIHAVLGIRQMAKSEWILKQRRDIARFYDQRLTGLNGINLVRIPDTVISAYYKYMLYINEDIDRDRLKLVLKNRYDICLPGEVYSDPCHSQPVFGKYPEKVDNNKNDSFPVTDYVCRHHICLPLYPGLARHELEYIVTSLKEAVDECSGNRR
ncbi:MAG: DegT/DnrJ/EryC1/StrS aminotransferase family protein [Candidatus Omnitrophota bacterium]|jgi:dTDP-4-amino-4,6-dideoxygalactose transaminase